MTFAQRRQERTALMANLLEQDWDVFGTLKFVNGRSIGRTTAHKLLRSYWNKVDRVFFGHAAERQNMRVPRWCFAHEGQLQRELPYSFCAEISHHKHCTRLYRAQRHLVTASRANSALG